MGSWKGCSWQGDDAKSRNSDDDNASKLNLLLGTWRDSKRSEYEVSSCSRSSLNVRTERPDGRVLHTRALIRMEESKDGRTQIAWGKNTSFILTSSIEDLNDSAVWISPQGKFNAFKWTRVGEHPGVDQTWWVEHSSASPAEMTEVTEDWPSWEEVLAGITGADSEFDAESLAELELLLDPMRK